LDPALPPFLGEFLRQKVGISSVNPGKMGLFAGKSGKIWEKCWKNIGKWSQECDLCDLGKGS